MLLGYKFRICPTIEQQTKLDHVMEACRFVYNHALETRLNAYDRYGESLSVHDLPIRLNDLKNKYPWITEIDSYALQASIKKMDVNFEEFRKGNRKLPRFRSRINDNSFKCLIGSFKFDLKNSTLSILEISSIPIVLSRQIPGTILNMTVSRTPTGKYFVAFQVDSNKKIVIPDKVLPETTVGLDVGVKSFVTTSDGEVFEANRKLKDNLKRLRCLQRRASKKVKGSKNQIKANLRVAKLHEKITNQRVSYIQQVTTRLIRDNQTESFVIENLNVAAMLGKREMSQSIADASFAEFFRQMKYKCKLHGKNLIVIDRFEPSSKTCSNCGSINDALTLKDREWTCNACGTKHDRDLNAAKNIKAAGLKK
ncbi:MAG TPA: RNA-guided endonuclease TnpB family protein [Puia sp.]|nr:RNA-guided endonuclease TnpB family protein [Puia sp.]